MQSVSANGAEADMHHAAGHRVYSMHGRRGCIHGHAWPVHHAHRHPRHASRRWCAGRVRKQRANKAASSRGKGCFTRSQHGRMLYRTCKLMRESCVRAARCSHAPGSTSLRTCMHAQHRCVHGHLPARMQAYAHATWTGSAAAVTGCSAPLMSGTGMYHGGNPALRWPLRVAATWMLHREATRRPELMHGWHDRHPHAPARGSCARLLHPTGSRAARGPSGWRAARAAAARTCRRTAEEATDDTRSYLPRLQPPARGGRPRWRA